MSGVGNIDIYVKHVFVTTIMVDPNRRVKGWVNCNDLDLTTARTDIVRDDTFDDFFDHLKKYLTRFPSEERKSKRERVQLMNQINKILKDYIKDYNIPLTGLVPQGRGKRQGDVDELKEMIGTSEAGHKKKESEREGKGDHHTIHKHPKQGFKNEIKTDFGLIWMDVEHDDPKEFRPIYFVKPNIMIQNVNHPLYKFGITNKFQWGYRWFRLLWLVSYAMVMMLPEYETMLPDQMYEKVCEIVEYILHKKHIV
jgi:hypothetical protein